MRRGEGGEKERARRVVRLALFPVIYEKRGPKS